MTERERFERLVNKYQPDHRNRSFFERPHFSRRCFFRNAAAGVGGFLLADEAMRGETESAGSVVTKNTARNVIFLFLRGAPSHVDTFDFKYVEGVTPKKLAPESFGDITLPTGILANTARVVDKLAIIRSGLSWARAHPLAQNWMQVGRNPTTATGRIAPHIGSVVAIEKDLERRADQVFPTFIALNAQGRLPGGGYFPIQHGPFRMRASSDGLAVTRHAAGRAVFNRRWQLLQELDGPLRGVDSPFGYKATGMGELYENAKRLMFNSAVEAAFTYTEEESARYGSTPFGNAVLTARKVIEQDQGTRFIQIDSGGWDHHGNIYNTSDDDNNNIYTRTSQFDPAFAALIEDLETAGKLSETLIVACGEFGRTPGKLSNSSGRDHYLQMFYLFAGGGVQGGTVIGATNDTGGRGPGAFTVEPGWSRDRDIRPEDVEATIYSAMGIDWTTIRNDDPLGRRFYYVPLAEADVYSPVNELWGSDSAAAAQLTARG